MESKDDNKNTEKYLDDILLIRLIDQGVQVMKKYKRYQKERSHHHLNINNSSITTETSTKKTEGNTGEPKPWRQSKSTGMEPLLSIHYSEKDSQQSMRRGQQLRNLQPSESMSLSMSQNLQSVSPW